MRYPLRSILTLSILALSMLFGGAVAQSETPDEATLDLIRQACLDYVDGYYSGDGDRVARGVHPELHKVYVRALPTGDEGLSALTQSMLVAVSRAGLGKLPEEERKIEVTVFDVFENVASAKIDSAQFVDFVHVALLDGKWRIVNVLWGPHRE